MTHAILAGALISLTILFLRPSRSHACRDVLSDMQESIPPATPWNSCEAPPATLVLDMFAVALRQGTSIVRAMDAIGAIIGGTSGEELVRVSRKLREGATWHDSWVCASAAGPRRETVDAVRRSLEKSWEWGSSPVDGLETAIRRMDSHERLMIREHASRLSVHLLMPMGLCFLPAFILVGVIPSIVSFAS